MKKNKGIDAEVIRELFPGDNELYEKILAISGNNESKAEPSIITERESNTLVKQRGSNDIYFNKLKASGKQSQNRSQPKDQSLNEKEIQKKTEEYRQKLNQEMYLIKISLLINQKIMKVIYKASKVKI
jgi:hypothetical protein